MSARNRLKAELQTAEIISQRTIPRCTERETPHYFAGFVLSFFVKSVAGKSLIDSIIFQDFTRSGWRLRVSHQSFFSGIPCKGDKSRARIRLQRNSANGIP